MGPGVQGYKGPRGWATQSGDDGSWSTGVQMTLRAARPFRGRWGRESRGATHAGPMCDLVAEEANQARVGGGGAGRRAAGLRRLLLLRHGGRINVKPGPAQALK